MWDAGSVPARVGIDDLLRIPPVFQIEVNGRTRSGTIQGQGNGQVLQTGGLQPHQHVPHTGTFELEHAGGISAGKHGINCRIVQRDRIYGECRFILLNGTDTVPDNCQVPQPQKIKFQQAHSFQNAHGILGDDGFLISLQRHQISDRHRRDQHAGAWVEACRGMPSTCIAISISFFAVESVSYSFRRSSPSLPSMDSAMLFRESIDFAILSHSP